MFVVTVGLNRMVFGIIIYEKNSRISGCINVGKQYFPVNICSQELVSPFGPNIDARGWSSECVS